MVTRLNLTGNELIIYAIIYGFSQAEDAEYAGTQGYFREWTSLSKQAVIGILKKLLDKGLIEKREVDVNGVIFNNYKCIPLDQLGVKNIDGGSKNLTGEVKKLDQGVVKKLDPHNDIPKGISNNIHKDNNIYIPESAPVSASNDPHCEAMPMPNNSSIPPTPLPSHDAFEECWKAYGRKGSKKKALEQWHKLSVKDAEQVPLHIPHYIKDREMTYRKDFERYLRDKIFLDPVWGKNNECLYDPANAKAEAAPEPKQTTTQWQ